MAAADYVAAGWKLNEDDEGEIMLLPSGGERNGLPTIVQQPQVAVVSCSFLRFP